MADLIAPCSYSGTSTWKNHQLRTTPSSEPGVDLYCPVGTPLRAPADGVIYGYGTSVTPATGRWIGIDFDNGMSGRFLHLKELHRTSGRVRQGEVIGTTGSSGYGSDHFGEPSPNATMYRNTGGPHTHWTMWPTRSRRYGYSGNGVPRLKGGTGDPFTIDPLTLLGGAVAGGGSTTLEDIMAKLDAEDRAWLDAHFTALRTFLQVPGMPFGYAQATLNDLRDLAPLIRDTQGRVRGADPRGDMLQLIREDLGRIVLGDVDEATLAGELAPLLPALVRAMSDEDVARIARATADEQAKRLAE